MKRFLLILICFLPLVLFAENPIDDDCTFNGIPLYGRVKIVEEFPTFLISINDSFPNLNVRIVDGFANECGEWQIVDDFPDFTIRIVEGFSDFSIKYVDVWPGIAW